MLFKLPTVTTALLTASLFLSACQPTSTSDENNKDQTAKQQERADNKPAIQSESAKARIAQFQPLYVAQMQSLQRRLQAEYDAYQAADNLDKDSSLLTTSSSEPAPPLATDANTEVTETESGDTEINTSTEVGVRDLQVLKRISLEPQQARLLTEAQTIKRYQQAIKALYEPVTTELSAQDIDTLINISTLIPQLFEHEEIAERVSRKSPALARLLVQYQVGKQIEAQQLLDMQQMKLTQQQEFEGLMTKFNDTIKGYDEQIAKYEQTLKEFQ